MNWINKLTLQDNLILFYFVCLYVADPATFPALIFAWSYKLVAL